MADKTYSARAELILAREDMWPLREVPLQPDPLTPFAFAFAELRDDLGDDAEVILDLLPVTRGAVARRRRKAVTTLGRGGRPVSKAGSLAEQLALVGERRVVAGAHRRCSMPWVCQLLGDWARRRREEGRTVRLVLKVLLAWMS